MWVVKQIGEAQKKVVRPRGQQPAARQQQQPRAQAAARNPAAGLAGQQADPLRNQVEEFLQRAGRQQQANQPRAAQRPRRPAPASEIEVLLNDQQNTVERRPLSEPFRPMGQPEAEAPQRGAARHPVKLPAQVERQRESVAEHVADHITAGARSVGQHSSQLGQRIITDDQQFDVRLKERFGHSLGSLGDSRADESPVLTPVDNSPVGQIAAMLASPGGVRQAMVINEILRRPSDRW
jgi:hypothetical protein